MPSATGPTPFANSSPPVSPEDSRPGFGVYVHWPFCQSLCPYCDFNSHVRTGVAQRRWATAYATELRHFAALTPGRIVTSVFFGGGTPSLMDAETVGTVLQAIGSHWTLAQDAEVTLEANPGSVEAGRFRGYRDAGVNRLSLGVQALNDADLTFLGRRHDRAEALAAIAIAADRFDRFSIDLMYGRPGQSVAAWRAELTEAVTLAGGHMSAYQLTIEPGTPFHAAQQRGTLQVPAEEVQAALYETTQDVLGDAGLAAYEISNHAKPGHACWHNLTYWRYGDYVGVGPGAHGRLSVDGQVYAARQHRAPEIWLERVESDGHATRTWQALDTAIMRDELFMMGLRLTDGIRNADVQARLGWGVADCLAPDALQRLIDGGFVACDDGGLRATDAGRQRLDAVLGALLS